MTNPNSINQKKENLATEVLNYPEIQAGIKSDLEAIKSRLTDSSTLQKYKSSFAENSNTEKLDLKNLTDVQISKIQDIIYLITGRKPAHAEINESAMSAFRQPFMGRKDSDSLDSPWYVTPNNAIQFVFTTPAMAAAAIAMTGAPLIPALIGAGGFTAAGYYALDTFTHKRDRKQIPSDEVLRNKTIKGRMAIAGATAALSSVFSIAGGVFAPATFNNPELKVEQKMVKIENVEKAIERSTNSVEGAKVALAESNPIYKTLVAKRDELSGRLTTETKAIKEIEEQLKKPGLSPSQITELNKQRQNYLAHIGTGKFSNQKQLEEFNQKIEDIESKFTPLILAKTTLKNVESIRADITNAWSKDSTSKQLKNLDGLKAIAEVQGISPEAVAKIAEGNLSGQQMQEIAAESLNSNEDMVSKGLTVAALAIEALVLLGRLANYSDKRKQMLLTQDFQEGTAKIGEGFMSEIAKLTTRPELPEDRADWTRDDAKKFKTYMDNKEVLSGIFGSQEYGAAIMIMAAEKQNALGDAMIEFENKYTAEFDDKASSYKNEKKVAGFEQSFQNAMVANDIYTMREELRRGINRAGLFKASENPNIKGSSKMSEVAGSVKRAVVNVKRFVTSPLNNLKNGQNKVEIMKAEILPANSILSLLDSMKDAKIKEVLQVKIGQMLLRYLKDNPGTNYTKAKVVEIANLPESNLTDEERQAIGSSLEDMNFGKHKERIRDIKSKFVEELNKTKGYKKAEKKAEKMMSELAKTVNQLEKNIDLLNTDPTAVSYRDNLNTIATTDFVALNDNEDNFYEVVMKLIDKVNGNYGKSFDIKSDELYIEIINKGGDPNDAILKRVFKSPAPVTPSPQTPPSNP